MINARRPRARFSLPRIVNGPVELHERFRARTRPQPRARNASAAWYRLVNQADATDLYLFDEVGCWGTSAQDLVDALKAVTSPTIRLHINSPGGDAWDGLAIYSCLKAHPAQVHVMVHGLAASAASFIAQAGDKVTINRNAMMMIHDASGLCWGNAADMHQMAALLDQLSSNLADIYSQRAGGSVEQWREAMRAESWYTGSEAVAAGLADEMTDPDPEPDAAAGMNNQWDLSVFRYAGRAAAPAPEVRGQAPTPGPVVEPPPAPATGVVTSLPPIGESGCTLVVPTVTTNAANPASTIRIEVNGNPGDIAAAVRDHIVGEHGPEPVVPTDTAVGPHETATEDGAWDAGAQEGRLPSPVPVATARKVYGWYDAEAVEDGKLPKSACKLPHHFVSADGTPGAASTNGVRNALARLPQTHGLTDAERDTIERHLRGHLPADEEDQAASPADDWAATVAALTDPDPWAALTAGLFTEDPAPSTEDDEFARLREALTCSES